MKDAVATMGGILPPDAAGRDAVHVAVFSAVAEMVLQPGEHIGIDVTIDINDTLVSNVVGPKVAIVDPFLLAPVEPGERFWAYLYPRTITALAHRWSHPAFEEAQTVYVTPAQRLEAEQALRDFCDRSDCPEYEYLVAIANKIADGVTREREDDGYHGWSLEAGWGDGSCLFTSGRDGHSEIPPDFWFNMETVIGRPIFRDREPPKYFTCSC